MLGLVKLSQFISLTSLPSVSDSLISIFVALSIVSISFFAFSKLLKKVIYF
ncbi:MAG: hypothetical protein IJV94_04825 [Bacilli bacterium]|nr:hypothetical protein [Bacilli bacterium]